MPVDLRPAGPGLLIVIGGAEDKLGSKAILSRFVRLAGGPQARLAILSTASSLGDEATELYRALFTGLGVSDVRGLRPLTRKGADSAHAVETVADATGIFMTGGNQLKLTTVVAGTALGRAIFAAYQRGAVVAGTSAGASAMSTHMVAFGSEGPAPKNRMAQLSAGLGLVDGVIIDQHFEQRTRIGRLLTLVAQSPSHLGLGVDEDTAALIDADGVLEVIGRGTVMVVDGTHVETNIAVAKRTDPVLVSGAVLHALPAGARFDLHERHLLPSIPSRDRVAVTEVTRVGEARRRLAQRVAAEGADDAVVERNERRRARRQRAAGKGDS